MSTQSIPQKIRVSNLKTNKSAPPPRSHLTIDLLSTVLQRTIFHPFVAWMIPLSLRAVTVPYEFLSMRLAIGYASTLTILRVLSYIDNRIAYGPPREVNGEEEVVVITGGASGLGGLVADFYAMRGATVAALDVKKMEDDEDKNVKYYQCDVGDAKQVEACAKKIREDLGVPTILINNAGIINGKSMLDLKPEDVERSFRVNVFSHFHTIRNFLPGMLEEGRGTIVTVASVLGHLGCANLADYTATKGGLLAMHTSLQAELEVSQHPGASNIKTVLVIPGQLSTPLFSDLQTPSNFLYPVVEPVELAKEIVQMIDSGSSGEVVMPLYAKLVPFLGTLPMGIQKIARQLSGMDGAMLDYSKKLGF